MLELPQNENTLLIRNWFGNDDAWKTLCRIENEPSGEFGFAANVDCISGPEYEGIVTPALLKAKRGNHSFLLVADEFAQLSDGNPILVLDLIDQPKKNFRVPVEHLWGVEK